jgi:hypothetical protein
MISTFKNYATQFVTRKTLCMYLISTFRNQGRTEFRQKDKVSTGTKNKARRQFSSFQAYATFQHGAECIYCI